MLAIYIFILMFINSINHLQKNIHSIFINRITIIILFFTIFNTLNTLYFQSIGKGISLFTGLFQATIQSHIVEILLIIVAIFILFGWPMANFIKLTATARLQKSATLEDERIKMLSSLRREGNNYLKSDQYSLIAIFSIVGGSMLMSSLDILSMYLSIELQSFALYILATLNKDKLSSTSAGLKYFLLGSLSSCFILLGAAIIYSYTGLTQFEAINALISVPGIDKYLIAQELNINGSISSFIDSASSSLNPLQDLSSYKARDVDSINNAFNIGLVIILIGFLFKISAAPFYQWAPDVYDGTPTIVTVWLTIVVKLTILIFLLNSLELMIPLKDLSLSTIEYLTLPNTLLSGGNGINAGLPTARNLLLISSLLSLLIGTVAGLSQVKVKRLLAFSSISHVGFLLLALGIFTQKSIDSYVFYLIQYSITSLNIFLILLAFGFIIKAFWRFPSSNNKTASTESLKVNSLLPDSIINNNAAKQDIAASAFFPLLAMRNPPKVGDALLASLAFGSREKGDRQENKGQAKEEDLDINYILELKGQLHRNPILSISLAVCLFSMAGIPPLIGFFSKQFVLFSTIENGNNFLSIVAILVSVISASYYLRLIKITFFENPDIQLAFSNKNNIGPSFPSLGFPLPNPSPSLAGPTSSFFLITKKEEEEINKLPLFYSVANLHSYIVSVLTLIILFFFICPSIILNGTQLISLTIFNL